MTRLIEIITAAIALISGFKAKLAEKDETIRAQASTISDQANTIANLQDQVANDSLDDAALKEAADAAKAEAEAAKQRLAELEDPELDTKAQELAELLNNTDETPSVDGDFNVTAGPTK